MSNKAMAHTYAKMAREMTDQVWISDNLPMLGRKERKEILAIYGQYFNTVEYDPKTGICKCWVTQPHDISTQAAVGEFNAVNGNTVSAKVKDSSLQSVGIDPAKVVDAGTIITNI